MLTPKEQIRRIMAFRNERKLYQRLCSATKEKIISAYPPDSPFIIYKNSIWWGDTWDALDYGQNFDFNRPFFEQFGELQKKVPREGTSIFNSENCDYNSHIRESKNCYLNALAARNEDIIYSYWMVDNKDCMDCMYTNSSTLCYECSHINNGYQCVMLYESTNCHDCYFSYQLRNCHNCLFCANLENKSYALFNQPCTREKFESVKNSIFNGSWKSWQEAKKRFFHLLEKTPRRYVHMLHSENCLGDHIYHSKNCDHCFECFYSEDCQNSISLGDSKDVIDSYSIGWPACEIIYSCCVIRGSTDAVFCTYVWFSQKMQYCDSCVSCQNCFGCIGLRHKKYCILNKQYSKNDYETLVKKIMEHMKRTGEWGVFFPPSLSPYAYNETAASDFFPLSKKEALQMGFRWREDDKKEYHTPTLATIPDNLKDVSPNIIQEILACERCKKNYKIIKQELHFYEKMSLPLPRYCPNCRHIMRFQQENPSELFDRQCSRCKKVIQSSYSEEKSVPVYCEECYRENIM